LRVPVDRDRGRNNNIMWAAGSLLSLLFLVTSYFGDLTIWATFWNTKPWKYTTEYDVITDHLGVTGMRRQSYHYDYLGPRQSFNTRAVCIVPTLYYDGVRVNHKKNGQVSSSWAASNWVIYELSSSDIIYPLINRMIKAEYYAVLVYASHI